MHKQSWLNNTVALFCWSPPPHCCGQLGVERLVLDVVEVAMSQSLTV